MPVSRRTIAWWGLALLLLATYALRVYRLDAVDLRGDEAYSIVHWTVPPFSDAWMKLARQEPHPAGAYTLYWAWDGLVGKSVFASRMVSVLGNVLGTAAIVALARRFFRNWYVVAAAGILWMLHPFLLWQAQDARTYGVLSALTPLTFYWLLRALESSSNTRSLRLWVPYIVLQALAIYLYYFEIFWLAAQGLYIFTLWQTDLLKQAFKAWLITGLMCIPVGVQAYYLLFVNHYEGNASDANFRLLFEEFVPTLLFGDNTTPLVWGLLFVVILIAGLIFVSKRHQQAWLLVFWVLVPPLLLYAVSNFSSFFRPRYVTTVIPALILGVVAIGDWVMGHYYPRLVVSGIMAITAVMGIVSVVEIRDYFFNDPPKAPDWVSLTNYLKVRTTAYDTVLFGQPDPAIEYYYPKNITFIPLENHNYDNAFAEMLATYDAIFLLTGERTAEAGAYFQSHAQHIPGDTFPGIIQFRSWKVNPREIKVRLEVQFGDIARLRGYTLLPYQKSVARDGVILLLYWEPLRQTASEHSILVHLVAAVEAPGDPPLPVAVVLDHGVAGSLRSTTQWTLGEFLRDPVAIPADLPAGRYFIRVGLYETANPDNRVPLSAVELESRYSGRYVIGELKVE